ncbi:hypothetical protein AURANDRAFT_16302, partial [Aureococcus anophagefferens]
SVPLHTATLQGFTACLHVLLRAGADVNAQGYDGLTALHQACHSGNVDAAKLIIAAGANLEARTRSRQGTTPL